MWELLAIPAAGLLGLILERRFRLTRRLPFQTPAQHQCMKCGKIDRNTRLGFTETQDTWD